MAYTHVKVRRFEYDEDIARDARLRLGVDVWYKDIIDMHHGWDDDEMLASWLNDGWGLYLDGPITHADLVAADAIGMDIGDYARVMKQYMEEVQNVVW
jgi:hypothetical protein